MVKKRKYVFVVLSVLLVTMLPACSTTNNKQPIEKLEDKEINEDISVDLFIPNGSLKVKNNCSDLVSDENYIKGNGIEYQVVGVNGKGPFVNVYEDKDNGLYKVYHGDINYEEINNVDLLDKRDYSTEELILKEPIKVGTRWDNKEIVEVGENLILEGIALKGIYVKTWEKEKDSNGNEVVKVFYYSEGLGCVKYKAIIDNSEVEWFEVFEIEKNN